MSSVPPVIEGAPSAGCLGETFQQARKWSPYWCFALGVLFVLVPNWPGRFNNDTVGMLQQIDNRRISNWHSPVLQYLYLPVRELGGGIAPSLMLTFTVAFGGLFLIFENFGLSRLKCSLLALGTCLFPVTYGLLSAVTRDAWFLALWLLGLGVARTHRVVGFRRLALVFVLLFFGYAARQNAVVIAPPLFAAALWDPAWAAARRLRWWTRCAASVGLALLIAAAMSVLIMLLPVRKQNPDAVVYLFDLIRVTVRDGEQMLPPELNPNNLTVDHMQEITEPWSLDHLVYARELMPVILDDHRADLARDAWLEFVTARPLDYIQMRWEVMTYQIGLGGNTRNAFLGSMIDNPWGIHATFPRLFNAATDYQASFTDGGTARSAGVVHRLWPVMMLSVVAIGAAARRRRGSPYSIDAFLSAYAALALLFVAAPQVHFRYVGPIYVVLGIACLGMLWPWFDSHSREQYSGSDERATTDPRFTDPAADADTVAVEASTVSVPALGPDRRSLSTSSAILPSVSHDLD